jgi:hypothetical protein
MVLKVYGYMTSLKTGNISALEMVYLALNSDYTVRLVPASTLIYLERVESSSAESNMLHPERIQVMKSNETEMHKCASPETCLT